MMNIFKHWRTPMRKSDYGNPIDWKKRAEDRYETILKLNTRVRELEAQLERVREWQREHRKLIDYIGETYPIPEALEKSE